MTDGPDGQFFCERCEGRYDQPGDCPRCPNEPLMDLTDNDVVLMLEAFDDAAKRKRYGVCFAAALVVTVPIAIALIAGCSLVDSRAVFKLALLLCFAVLAGLTTLFATLFPARRRTPRGIYPASVAKPEVTSSLPAAIPSDALGTCAECLAPIDENSAYLDDDGLQLCHGCFLQDQADRDEERHGADFSDPAAGQFGRMVRLGVSAVEGLADVPEELRNDNDWADRKPPEDEI